MANAVFKLDIKKRALRAAAGVALLGTGCGGEVPTTNLEAQNAPGTPNVVHTNPSAPTGVVTAEVPRAETEQREVGRSFVSPVDAGVTDAGAERCTLPNGGEQTAWEEYTACCEAIGWDFNRGCMAWGPPVPPSMDEEVV